MPADLTREGIDAWRKAFIVVHGAYPPTALGPILDAAEAHITEPARLASARAEGVREGIEMAAHALDDRVHRLRAFAATLKGAETVSHFYARAEAVESAASVVRALSPPPAEPTGMTIEPGAPVAPDWPTRCAALEADGIAARKRVAALEAENAKLREGLSRAAAQFEFYRDQHTAKGTPEGYKKATTNANMAALCRTLLQGYSK